MAYPSDNTEILDEIEEAIDNFPMVWDDLELGEDADSEKEDATDSFDAAWYALQNAYDDLKAAFESATKGGV